MTETSRNSLNRDTCGSHPLGKGLRPSFHALWHLPEGRLGVVKDLTHFESADWEEASTADKPVRVAIIDTPIAHDHPNLQGAIDLGLMRDFSLSPAGAFVLPRLDPTDFPDDDESRQNLKTTIEQKNLENEPLGKRILAEIHGPDTDPPHIIPGAHGTALAGLIGARPARVCLRKPDYHEIDKRCSIVGAQELPYCGINPFCRIVPISIGAGPDPDMLAGALDYAYLIDADIVVIADSWDRPDDWHRHDGWRRVETVFLKLCRQSRVFCAAGNEPADALVYPAALARKPGKDVRDTGPWAVGACTLDGKDLSYSPNWQAINGNGHRMIRTLSTEHSRYDREVGARLDPWEIVDEELGRPPGDPDFPPHDIISTDVPGPAGYNPSVYDHTPGAGGEHYEIASLYCRFSGTSAATAIAAGLVSLAMQSGKSPGQGRADPGATLFDLGTAARLVCHY
ncbi:S8/S53 family peptidase [Rhodovulum marinum]|uniref:Subtilase family protein n=1 Tax=Rhodovulum marinum TaxID=320662 RepID=A0A4R2Q943_9RHOB|nr:S8/S53 family peptidase [Rhodovulum marinum]TCP43255.1 subtilase family protein [Rhodovulum marinum]